MCWKQPICQPSARATPTKPDISRWKRKADNRCLAKANTTAGYNYKGAIINQDPDSYLYSLVLNLNHVSDSGKEKRLEKEPEAFLFSMPVV